MSMTRSRLRAVLCLWAGCFLGLCTAPAVAQHGTVLTGVGPINRSMGGASTAAPLSSAGALYWNPATLSGLNQSELEIGAELLFPHASLGSRVPANTFGPGVPPIDLSGTTKSEDSVYALPTMALSYQVEETPFTFGLGVFAAAGFGLNYPGSFTNPVLTPAPPVGLGFGPIMSQYQVLQIAPAFVVDASDNLSLSLSPILNLGSLQVDPAVFAAPDDANLDTFATYPSATHSRTAWGVGFQLGAYYDAGDWAFGASYKSEQWFDSYRWNTTDELGLPRSIAYRLNLPAIYSIGTSYRGFENLILAADVRYLDYANANGFGDSGFAPNGALQGLGQQSIVAVALGAQYQATDNLSLRIGYSWNENPISSPQSSANVASPLVLQNLLSFGGSYHVSEALTLSLAYTHGFENSVTGPLVLPLGSIPGTSVTNTASADMVIVGATVRFGCPKYHTAQCPTYR
ncbi:MAG: outer membrane protein transport protein [Planctomycetaceae bacterium]